jgi:hypothetical protein
MTYKARDFSNIAIICGVKLLGNKEGAMSESEENQEKDGLFLKLQLAYEDCFRELASTYATARKHAPLCVKIVRQFPNILGNPSDLIHRRIQKRVRETRGRTIFEEDFWANEEMIMSLFQHIGDRLGIAFGNSYKEITPNASA